jgi:hypothetical protein
MTMRAPVRLLLAALLGLAAALLVSCGGSGKGLIPQADAGPLRGDFEAVAQAAQLGDGSCVGTEKALGKTERDFLALPASVDAGLRSRLQQGISNLRQRALAMCAQPVPTVTTATSSQTTSTPTQTTPTATTPTAAPPTTTTPPPASRGGGTPAEEAQGEGEDHGKGKDKGKGAGKGGAEAGEAESGGASAGGASAGGR